MSQSQNTTHISNGKYDVEKTVRDRYAAGARQAEAQLCCPVDYDRRYLEILPPEIIERDYGCGDPSRWVGEGETALDLGSGAGKICYILAQKVGPHGKVIGIDFNDAMLALARKYQPDIGNKLGYENTRFVKGRIQDLGLDLNAAESWLHAHPVTSIEDWGAFEAECSRLRVESPLIGDDSVDVVVSNCVLNLVRQEEKERLFDEIFRVLRRGGRAVISDIVCDEDPTPAIMADPDLWSGCISGAFREDTFLKMFERAGFHGIEIVARQSEPWRVIDGIEFRSLTVRAFKGKQGPCLERNQAVVYRGPWSCVVDDDGHRFVRGDRTAVCDKTYDIMTDSGGPYAGEFFGVEPRKSVPLEDAKPMDCARARVRHPRETKGLEYHETRDGDQQSCCGPDECC